MDPITEDQLIDLDRLVRRYEFRKEFGLKSPEELEQEWRAVLNVAMTLARDLHASLIEVLGLARLTYWERKAAAKSDSV